MPLQDIMNAPQSFGPSITQRQDALDMGMAKGYADVGNSLAETEMKNMQIGQQKKKQSLLENFQGKTNTPEFYNAMDAIDPETTTKMIERASKMDKNEREKIKEYMGRVAAKAQMAETEQDWVQQGFTVPFSEKEKILGAALTYQQVFDRQQAEVKATTGENSRGGLKAADENAIQSYSKDLFKGVYNPVTGGFMGFKNDTSRQQAAKVATDASVLVKNNPNMTLHEAVMQAAQMNGVEFEEKTAPAKGGGKDPLGLR